jgi:hypothetical protein
MADRYTQAADNWGKGVSAAGGRWMQGVQGVTESPTQGAKKAKQRMIDGFAKSMSDQTFERGCDRVTAQSWQQSCQQRQGNYTSSASAKKGRYASYITQAKPELQQIKSQADAMPSDTLDQRIEKANFVMRETAKLRGKYRAA